MRRAAYIVVLLVGLVFAIAMIVLNTAIAIGELVK